MSDYDLEEAHYFYVIGNVCDLIKDYGYTKVLMDIDKHLKSVDLEVTLANVTDTLEQGN